MVTSRRLPYGWSTDSHIGMFSFFDVYLDLVASSQPTIEAFFILDDSGRPCFAWKGYRVALSRIEVWSQQHIVYPDFRRHTSRARRAFLSTSLRHIQEIVGPSFQQAPLFTRGGDRRSDLHDELQSSVIHRSRPIPGVGILSVRVGV